MKPTLASLAAGLLLTACTGAGLFSTPSPTPVPPTITPTPIPLAALVNGEGILLSDLAAELARFEAAQAELGIDLASLGDVRATVLEALIERALLAQGAKDSGSEISPAELQTEIDRLAQARGGNEAMGAWLAQNGYTLEAFARALREDMLATRMIEEITASIGETSEQVRAAHVLVASRAEADGLQAEAEAGSDFGDLARQWSLDASTRPAGGDLGWFPRGYLLVPEVDQAAWALVPGGETQVVESVLGFHLVQVIERGEHALSPDARRYLRESVVQAWLVDQRQASQIEILPSP